MENKILKNRNAVRAVIINKDKIQSYSSENMEIDDRMIPIGLSMFLSH